MTCAELQAQYDEVLEQLAAPAGSASDQGRSVSVNTADLEKRLTLIAKLMAAKGCANAPAVVPPPVFTVSRTRV